MRIGIVSIFLLIELIAVGNETMNNDQGLLVPWINLYGGKDSFFRWQKPIFDCQNRDIFYCDAITGRLGVIQEFSQSNIIFQPQKPLSKDFLCNALISVNTRWQIIKLIAPATHQARAIRICGDHLYLLSVLNVNNAWFRLLQQLSRNGEVIQSWAQKCGPNFESRAHHSFEITGSIFFFMDTFSQAGLDIFDSQTQSEHRIVFQDMLAPTIDKSEQEKLLKLDEKYLGVEEKKLLTQYRADTVSTTPARQISSNIEVIRVKLDIPKIDCFGVIGEELFVSCSTVGKCVVIKIDGAIIRTIDHQNSAFLAINSGRICIYKTDVGSVAICDSKLRERFISKWPEDKECCKYLTVRIWLDEYIAIHDERANDIVLLRVRNK